MPCFDNSVLIIQILLYCLHDWMQVPEPIAKSRKLLTTPLTTGPKGHNAQLSLVNGKKLFGFTLETY